MNRKIVTILSLIIGGEACIVMAGWIFHIHPLTHFLANGINMKFPTAILFLISAIGLYFIGKERHEDNEWAHLILPGVSLVIFLLSSALLAAGIFNTTTGIESIYLETGAPPFDWGSGWPSLPTLINFILFGVVSLFALFFDTGFTKVHFFGYVIFIVGFFAALGYLLRVPSLYYQFNATTIPMASNTSLMFILLGIGLVLIGKMKRLHEV